MSETSQCMTDPNLARARAYIMAALDETTDRVLGVPGCYPPEIVDACARAIIAVVRAKGETFLAVLRDPAVMGRSALPNNPDAIWSVYVSQVLEACAAHAADVPPPPGTP